MWQSNASGGGHYGGSMNPSAYNTSQPPPPSTHMARQAPPPPPPTGCEICSTPQFVSHQAADAHYSSYRHCEAFLLKELSLGFSRFSQVYGSVKFGLTLEEGADLPENQFEPFDRLDLHLYRTFLVKKGYCMLCESAIGSGLQGWRIHVKGQQHAQNYVKTLEQLGSVAAYRQKFGCLTDPPPNMIELAKKSLQQYKADSYQITKQTGGVQAPAEASTGNNNYSAYYTSNAGSGSSSYSAPSYSTTQQPYANTAAGAKKDSYSTSYTPQQTGYGNIAGPAAAKKDSYSTSYAPQQTGYGVAAAEKKDSYSTSYAPQQTGYGATAAVKTSYSPQRPGYGNSASPAKKASYNTSYEPQQSSYPSSAAGAKKDSYNTSYGSQQQQQNNASTPFTPYGAAQGGGASRNPTGYGGPSYDQPSSYNASSNRGYGQSSTSPAASQSFALTTKFTVPNISNLVASTKPPDRGRDTAWLEMEKIRAEKEALSRELAAEKERNQKRSMMMELEDHRRYKAEMEEQHRRREEQKKREREQEEARRMQQQLAEERRLVEDAKREKEEMERERRHLELQKRELEEVKRQTWLLNESRKLELRLSRLLDKFPHSSLESVLRTMIDRVTVQRNHFEIQCDYMKRVPEENKREEEVHLHSLYSQLRVLVEELHDQSAKMEKQLRKEKRQMEDAAKGVTQEKDRAPNGGDVHIKQEDVAAPEDGEVVEEHITPPSEKMMAVRVTNLPKRSSDQNLKNALFHGYKMHGRIICTVLLPGPPREAVITFKHEEDAAEALVASKKKEIMAQQVICFPHPGFSNSELNVFGQSYHEMDEFHHKASRSLFVGNVDQNVADTTIKEKFAEFGTILNIQYKDLIGPTFYFFIEYDDIVSVKNAIETMDGQYMGSSKLKCGFAKPKESCCLWLGGLPEDINEVGIRSCFETFGLINKVTLHSSKGRGLVEYSSIEGSRKAVLGTKGVTNPALGKKIMVDFASMKCQESLYEAVRSDRSKDRDGAKEEEREGEIVDKDENGKLPFELCAVQLSNLPVQKEDDDIRRALFHRYKRYGKILNIRVRGSAADRVAVITFQTASEANEAHDGTLSSMVLGRHVNAEKVDGAEITEKINEYHHRASRTLYIGMLDKKVSRETLEAEFAPYGKILSMVLTAPKATLSTKYAFIEYDSVLSTVKAIQEKDACKLGDEKITLYFGKTLSPDNVVQLENVSEFVNLKYLSNIYTKHGVEIKDVQVDKERGRCLVYLANTDAAWKVVHKMKGMVILGKKSTNDYASPECQNNFYEVQDLKNPHPVMPTAVPTEQEKEEEEGMERFGAYEYDMSRGTGQLNDGESWTNAEDSMEYDNEENYSRSGSPYGGMYADRGWSASAYRQASQSPGRMSPPPQRRKTRSPRRKTRSPRRRAGSPHGVVSQSTRWTRREDYVPSAAPERTPFLREATHTVFVGNFDPCTDRSVVEQFFEGFGPILDMEMKVHTNKSFAFVELTDPDKAVDCINAHKFQKIDGKQIKFGFGKAIRSRVLWVGNLPEEACEEMLLEELDQFGSLLRAAVNKQKKSALVFFSTVHDAFCTFEGLCGGQILGNPVSVDYASLRVEEVYFDELVESGQMTQEDRDRFFETHGGHDTTEDDGEEEHDFSRDTMDDTPEEVDDEYGFRASRTVFIGQLSKRVNKRQLADIFAECGELLNVSVKESDYHTNFAHAEYSTIRAAANASKTLHNMEIAGRNIRVNFAKPRPFPSVHIEYLPDGITEEKLFAKFSEYGQLLKVCLNVNCNTALLIYGDPVTAAKAKEDMHGKELDGQRVILTFSSKIAQAHFKEKVGEGNARQDGDGDKAKGKRPKYSADELPAGTECRGIMVWNIPERMSDHNLTEGMHFQFKRYGKITNITIKKEDDLRYVVITFKKAKHAAEAVEQSNRKRLLGQIIFAEKHEGMTDDTVPTMGQIDEFRYNASRTIYVGNLPTNCSSTELTNLFSKYGKILNIHEPGRLRFTAIEYATIQSVVQAIENMDGDDFKDKKLSVNFSRLMNPSDCLWVDHIAAIAMEEDILQFAAQRPDVCNIVIDRDLEQALIFYNSIEMASKALPMMKKKGFLLGQKVAIDYGSRVLKEHILDNMEKTKQITCVEKKELMAYQLTEGDTNLVADETDRTLTESTEVDYSDTGYFKYASKNHLTDSECTPSNPNATRLLCISNVEKADEDNIRTMLADYAEIKSMVFVPFRRCFVEFQKVLAVVTMINELHDTTVDWLTKPLRLGFGVRYVDPNAPREHRENTILSAHFVNNRDKFKEKFGDRYGRPMLRARGRGGRGGLGGGRGRDFQRPSPQPHRRTRRSSRSRRRSPSPFSRQGQRSPVYRHQPDNWFEEPDYDRHRSMSPNFYNAQFQERFSPNREGSWGRDMHHRSPQREFEDFASNFGPCGRFGEFDRFSPPRDFGGRRVEIFPPINDGNFFQAKRSRSPSFGGGRFSPERKKLRRRSPRRSKSPRRSPRLSPRRSNKDRSPRRPSRRSLGRSPPSPRRSPLRRSPRRTDRHSRSPRRIDMRRTSPILIAPHRKSPPFGRSPPRRSRSRHRSPKRHGGGRKESPARGRRGGRDKSSAKRSPRPGRRSRARSSNRNKDKKHTSSAADIWKKINVPVGMTMKQLQETIDTFGEILNKFLDVLFGKEPIKRRVQVEALPGAELAVAMELKHLSGVNNYEVIVNALDLLAVLPREVPYVLNMLTPEVTCDLAIARGHKVGNVGKTISKFMCGMLR